MTTELARDLAGNLLPAIHHRIASANNLANTICTDEGYELNELQRIALMQGMLAAFEGLEAELAGLLGAEASLRTGRMNHLLGYDIGGLPR